MTEPTVACIMLTRDRTEMARRAVECFRQQECANKLLLIYFWRAADLIGVLGGKESDFSNFELNHQIRSYQSSYNQPVRIECRETIGKMRNDANAQIEADIVIHFDDDDYSHPNRIAEQVALLQASGADAVGYREVLFWRDDPGEAWLYSNPDPRYVIGSSLCYTRASWEKNPFRDRNRGEDREFIRDIRSIGVSGIVDGVPRMICRVHKGNAHNYPLDELSLTSPNWKRTPEWDETLRRSMEVICA